MRGRRRKRFGRLRSPARRGLPRQFDIEFDLAQRRRAPVAAEGLRRTVACVLDQGCRRRGRDRAHRQLEPARSSSRCISTASRFTRSSTPARPLRSCPCRTSSGSACRRTPVARQVVRRGPEVDRSSSVGKFASFAIGNEDIPDVEILRCRHLSRNATYQVHGQQDRAGTRSSKQPDASRRRLPALAPNARRRTASARFTSRTSAARYS